MITNLEYKEKRMRPSAKLFANESQLVSTIIARLHDLPNVHAWRCNSGMATLEDKKTGKRRKVRMAPAGTPDIVGFVSGGKFLGIECKHHTNSEGLSNFQRAWLEKLEEMGGIPIVACSFEDVKEAFKKEGIL